MQDNTIILILVDHSNSVPSSKINLIVKFITFSFSDDNYTLTLVYFISVIVSDY